jgi:tripartite-type tricarboxylate transporter receptor subunit TctC
MDRTVTNNVTKWFLVSVLAVTILMPIGTGQGLAQEKYPSRGITIICPQTTGATDLSPRAMLPFLQKKFGVPVNVVNKPGGNSVPAQLELYGAPPDGYTLLADAQPFTSLLPLIVRDVPFKIMDRTFIAVTTFGPGLVIVPANSPYKTLADLIADVKKDPGEFTWAGQGGIGGSDYHTRRFLKSIGVDVTKTKQVMTKGGAEGAAMVAGGHVKTTFAAFPSAIPHLSAGTVRALAVLSVKRDDMFPNVPSMGELGYPNITTFWMGVSGPPKLPASIVELWDRTIREMHNDPEYLGRLKNLGLRPMYLNAADMRELVVKDMREAQETYSK